MTGGTIASLGSIGVYLSNHIAHFLDGRFEVIDVLLADQLKADIDLAGVVWWGCCHIYYLRVWRG